MRQRVERDGRGGSRGVSNVIGVVLIVAITILLVSVVAVFAVGFTGDVQEPVPNVATTTSFDDRWDPAGQYLNITFKGGETIDTDDLRLDVDGAEIVDGPPSGTRTDAQLDGDPLSSQLGPEISASDRLVVDRRVFTAGGSPLVSTQRVDLTDATVRIIYSHGEGERTDILYECRIASPDCESNPV